MSKTAEFIKLLSVLILCVLIVGVLGFFVPKIAKLSDLPQQPTLASTHHKTSSAGYGENLSIQIKQTLEKITGPNTVEAFVVADIVQDAETVQQNTILPDSVVLKQRTRHISGDTQTVNQETAVFDYSTEKRLQTTQTTQIIKQSITVLVDGYTSQSTNGQIIYHPRSQNELKTYRTLIMSLCDFTPERGDTLELLNLPFSQQPDNTIFGFNKTLVIQSVLLGLLFIVCVLILIRFILPMIFMIMQPAPVSVHQPYVLPQTSAFDSNISGNKSDAVKYIFKHNQNEALSIIKQWMYADTQNQNDTLSGIQKTAILLLAIGEEYIKSTFLKLKSEEVIDISRTMAQLGCIKGEIVQQIFDLFLNTLNGSSDLNTGSEYIYRLVENMLPEQEKNSVLQNVSAPIHGKNIWEKLEKTDTEKLAEILKAEYPQTIAVILYHLSNEKSGNILSYFSESLTMDILMRLTALQKIDADTLSGVEKGLETKLKQMHTETNQKSGKEKAADILSLMDTKTDILNTLFERSPELADQLSSNVIMFEDIADWSDTAIRTLLSKIDRQIVVYALKGASDKVKEAFSRNMSPAVWGSILKETNKLSAVRLKEIDMAQHTLVRTAQELIEHKKINPRG